MRLFPIVVAIIALGIAVQARAACPTQASPIVAVGGALKACVSEAATAIEIERDGIVQPQIPGPFVAGVTSGPLTGLAVCGVATLRARSVNAAGAGQWGATSVVATFPPCATASVVLVP